MKPSVVLGQISLNTMATNGTYGGSEDTAADRNVEMWKIKKLIKSLEQARGYKLKLQICSVQNCESYTDVDGFVKFVTEMVQV